VTTCSYTRGRWLVGVVGQDVLLALALLVVAAGWGGALGVVLALAIPLVLAWSVATLHFPSHVAWDEEGITFGAYGRVHTFAWQDVTRVSVRRFLVRDRVLVRVAPAPAWRGRYWLLASMDGYDALVAELEKRRTVVDGAGVRRP
jgi:hypothetical protein